MLTVSPAHRLFMWLCEEQPLPLSAAHPHPSVSHSAWAGLRGKSDLFCRGEFLGEIVKPVTVWAFISVERRRGRKERRNGQEGDRGESRRRVGTQTALLSSPKEREDEGGGEEPVREWNKQKDKKELTRLRHQCYSPPLPLFSSAPPYPFPPSGTMHACSSGL